MNSFRILRPTAVAALVAVFATDAQADAPQLQTQGRVIFLADNLDESQNLGWCIDTLGRGFSEQLQAHSCKPQGGDVQFGFNPESLQIQSVEFDGKCMTLLDATNGETPFGLFDCTADDPAQKFRLNPDTGEITLANAPNSCVVVAPTSRQAGPFMSRDLLVADCQTVDPSLKSWIQQN